MSAPQAADTRDNLTGGLPVRFFFGCLWLATLGGCALTPPQVGELTSDTGYMLLDNTPFFAQQRYQCGPAALATTLVASGVATSPERLVPLVYLPNRQGSIRTEMVAATRSHERLPYRIEPTLQAIADELALGRPVLILQNLGLSWYPRWHYAVVVGIDPVADQVLLRSGTERLRRMRVSTFLNTWQRGEFWGIVTLPPEALPANPNSARLIQTISALEQTGHSETAAIAWRTLANAMPELGLARFALGNQALDSGDAALAEGYYRQALAVQPDLTAARNNLALALLRQGHHEQALAAIREAIKNNQDPQLSAQLADTEREILAKLQSR